MRLAVLADIHGNLPALRAVLEFLDRHPVDLCVVAGDIVVGSPDSRACWELIRERGWPVLRGNHERYVFDLGTPRAGPEWSSARFGPVHYAARSLGEAIRRELAALPLSLRLPRCPDMLFTHGSPRADSDLVFPYTPEAELEPMFASHPERWILRGHNHFAAVRLWRDRRIVTVGSVGLPLDGTPAAQFTLLERRGSDWRVEHRKVDYDVHAAARRFVDSGYLEEGGPMARLYLREVVTASFHVLPFLAWYRRVCAKNPAFPLEAAVRKFCPLAYEVESGG